jgi:SAM-dependent MidA family methyltransferase
MTASVETSAPDSLEGRLRERIGREGPISYESFVETVLYDEQHGYYRAGKQEGVDYSTSPEIHALFGRTVGRYMEDVCERLGRSSVNVLELGGASGRLAVDIASAFTRLSLEHYIILEKGRKERRDRIRWVETLDEVPRLEGLTFVVANEFFDALPFHKVISRQGAIEEVYVGWEDGFFEQAGPPGAGLADFLRRYPVYLHEGQVSEATSAALPIVRAVSGIVAEGCFLIFDYGYHRAEIAAGRFFGGSGLGYKQRKMRDDPFAELGTMDITHHVNFDHLRAMLEDAGWRSEGETAQYRFLCAAGALEALGRMPAAERASAKWLINPEGLGAMISVLAFSRNIGGFLPGFGRRK